MSACKRHSSCRNYHSSPTTSPPFRYWLCIPLVQQFFGTLPMKKQEVQLTNVLCEYFWPQLWAALACPCSQLSPGIPTTQDYRLAAFIHHKYFSLIDWISWRTCEISILWNVHSDNLIFFCLFLKVSVIWVFMWRMSIKFLPWDCQGIRMYNLYKSTMC